MTEQFRPQPEDPKNNSPEPGAGQPGQLRKPPPEQQPQGGEGKSPELPPSATPQSEPTQSELPLERVMREAIQRMSDSDRERLFERLKALNRIRMQDMKPKYANYLRRLVGDPLDSSLSDEELQRMFDLPSTKPEPDDER